MRPGLVYARAVFCSALEGPMPAPRRLMPLTTAALLALVFAVVARAQAPGADGSVSPTPQASVDTALIVAVDVSQSVDEQRYRLQMQGIAHALEDPAVLAAIANGPNGGILFTMVAWSDKADQILDWHRIGSREDAAAVAEKVRALPHSGGEFTCMARMLRSVALKFIPAIPIKAERIVVDVSGDGVDNCSDRDTLHEERDRVLALSATINGLPIIVPGENDVVGSGAYRAPGFGLRELPQQPDKETTTLDRWFTDHVIGGPGAFLMIAQGYGDFGRALRQKFVTEISSTADPLGGQPGAATHHAHNSRVRGAHR
jgi:hypothetical protein